MTAQALELPIMEIERSPFQPRRDFNEEELRGLAESLKNNGLVQPPTVRRNSAGRYELISGERRLRALRLLGEEETDAVVMTACDRESALIALVENIQRENLSFFEEAEAYQALVTEQGMSREELAGRLNRSPSAVANRLNSRLTELLPVGLRLFN